MPRYSENYSTTPFARVLTAYMWSKTPPWTVPKLAAVLGVQRNRVSNWVFHDIVPEIDTMLAVMAKLNIPVSRLLNAYTEAGQPVPPLTEADAAREAALAEEPAAAPAAPVAPASAAQASIPPARRGRGGGVGHRAGQLALQPAPEAAPEEEWETMVAHTRKIMTAAGMPSAAIEAMLAELEQRRAGKPSAAQRRIDEEMASDPHANGESATRPNGAPSR